MTWPCLGSNHLLASHLGLYRFKIGPKTTEIQLFVCENSIDSKGYEWVNCTAWEPHLHCSNWVKSHIFEWNVYFSVHMVEKIKNLFIDFIWLNNDQNRCQKWPFSLISPNISNFVLKILKPCKGNQIKLIFFSGYFDIEQSFLVKNFEIWQKMRQWRGGSIFKVSQKRIMNNWPCSNKEPSPPWLKLCQISNFLTQMASLVSEWPEKVKKSSIEHYLASEPSKPFSEKPLFSDIIQHIWLCFDESEAL